MIIGMELMANKFQVIVTSMRKKPYDYLDQRKMDFDSDYEDFKRLIQDLHVRNIYYATMMLTFVEDLGMNLYSQFHEKSYFEAIT